MPTHDKPRKPYTRRHPKGIHSVYPEGWAPCPFCDATGLVPIYFGKMPCPRCDGSGMVAPESVK